MKNAVICIVIFFPAMLFNCASMMRPPLNLSSPEDCRPVVGENLLVKNAQPADSMLIIKAAGSTCYTHTGALLLAKKKACEENYQLASLVNIQRPGYFFGPCYRAKVLFYTDSGSYSVSEEPVLDFIPTRQTGILAGIDFQVGPMVAGEQSRSGLISEKGDEASTTKIQLGIYAKYFPVSRLGLGGKISWGWSDASAPQTEAMSFTTQFTMGGIIEGILWKKQTARGLFNVFTSFGLYYTKLKFADEFREFVESNEPIELTNNTADGMGYELGLGFRNILVNRVLWDVSINYQLEKPKFPGALIAIDGIQIGLKMSTGYKIW